MEFNETQCEYTVNISSEDVVMECGDGMWSGFNEDMNI